MLTIIQKAITKGAKLYSNISGGKDGQAMTAEMIRWGLPIEALVHADLGRAEWKESKPHCIKIAETYSLPLFSVVRSDGLDLVDYWKRRMYILQGTGKPFWSSSAARYCTSDMKRAPINAFYTSTGHNFIISCEGIRGQESTARAKKEPLTIRSNSSTFYDGMTVEEAIDNFRPDKKLFLTYYPLFNYTLEEVWNSCGNTSEQLTQFRIEYKATGIVNPLWNFHPVYVYGNDRVSCAICVLASENDIRNGAEHNPELLTELVEMEEESGFTFRQDFSLKLMQKIKKPKKKAA